MIIEFITEGRVIDVSPNQDVALTLENPLFSTDLPIAWTTNIEAPLSPNNRVIFGWVDTMVMPLQKRAINVEMRINSISFAYGQLKAEGAIRNKCIKISFSGASIEDSLKGKLKDANFAKWNFGKLGEFDDNSLYNSVMNGAARNIREDFATPLMMRENMKDIDDVLIDLNTESTKKTFAAKYLNSPMGTFFMPVVRLKYILQTVFVDCQFDNIFADFIETIGIIAPYRKNSSINDYEQGCLDTDENGNFVLDLANTMPDICISDFVKYLLTTFCATIYITKEGKKMMANKTIINSRDFVDWTDKISDDYEYTPESGQNYEYGYANIAETKTDDNLIEYQTIEDCFHAPDGSVVMHSATQDTYQVIEKLVRYGMSSGESYSRRENYLSLLRQGRMSVLKPDNDLETYSATTNFIPVKTIPYKFYDGGFMINFQTSIMLPIIDVPAVGGSRPSDVQFGMLTDKESDVSQWANKCQLTSTGWYNKNLPLATPWLYAGHTLSMTEADGIYELFHRDFAQWLKRDKSIFTSDVNLSILDIINLQLWKRVMLYNQLFFIKKLFITLNTSTNDIVTSAEFITA